MVTIAVTSEGGDEPRFAASPETVKKLSALGATVRIQAGAGGRSRFSDAQLTAQGAQIVPTAGEALAGADILLKVRRADVAEIAQLKPGAFVVSMVDPYGDRGALEALAASKASIFAMELMPRITRAQSMDVLSSQANL
ncbi:MAG: NAD(P)(+) transhydrogenase (Re/Si-specific) subunit alpha, partial [Hyphomicrobiaceae bacterium]|nr:NAD(P)(+) transhydrogenase (Re/Si-specific) subunit alpha [Hyphomicrobiaceae bacterium]